MNTVEISRLLEKETELSLRVITAEGGVRGLILNPRIQKPGLALAGFVEHLHSERLQIIGLTEISYLEHLSADARRRGAQALMGVQPCAVVVTRDLVPPPELVEAAQQHRVPLLSTPLMSSVFINRVTKYLELHLAPTASIHGVLVDVWGVGILILGKSGVGKSETALDLVLRGHRLVCDDVVFIRKIFPDRLYGSGMEVLKQHLEVRGLGVLNIKDLFGVAAVRDAKRVELVVELVEWNAAGSYDRLGTEDRRYVLLDVTLPFQRIPVHYGRSTSSLLEVAARNQLLMRQGIHSARNFQEQLQKVRSMEPRPFLESDVE